MKDEELMLDKLCDDLNIELSGFLNTGLDTAKIIRSKDKHSADYVLLIFERNDQKYHTPKIFTKPNQDMIRIYKLDHKRFLIDVCSKSYEIDHIETFWLPNVRTKSELFRLNQKEGAICHIIDANQDVVFAWGSWIPLNLLKPKMIYQSDFRQVIECYNSEEIIKRIYNNW